MQYRLLLKIYVPVHVRATWDIYDYMSEIAELWNKVWIQVQFKSSNAVHQITDWSSIGIKDKFLPSRVKCLTKIKLQTEAKYLQFLRIIQFHIYHRLRLYGFESRGLKCNTVRVRVKTRIVGHCRRTLRSPHSSPGGPDPHPVCRTRRTLSGRQVASWRLASVPTSPAPVNRIYVIFNMYWLTSIDTDNCHLVILTNVNQVIYASCFLPRISS